MPWSGTHVKKNAYIRLPFVSTRSPLISYKTTYLQERTESVEEPPVAIDLLLISFLHAENNLRRHDALVGILEVQIGVNSKRRRVLEQVSGNRLVVNNVSHVPTRLIHAKKRQAIENAWVYLPTTIGNDAYNHLGAKVSREADAFAETDLLPCLNSPCVRIFTTAQVRNVAHNAIQCSAE